MCAFYRMPPSEYWKLNAEEYEAFARAMEKAQQQRQQHQGG